MTFTSNILTKGANDFSKRDIVEVLASIKFEEERKFNRFIKRNGTASSKKLWKVLRDYRNKGFKVNDDQLFSRIYPKKEFNRNLFNGWVVSLSELAKEFIVLQEFKKDKIKYLNAFANALLLRGATKSYRRLYQKNCQRIQEESYKSIDLYTHLHEKEYIHRQYTVRYDPSNQNDSIEETIHFNDIGYIGRNLRYYTSVLIQQRIANEQIDLPTKTAFFNFVANFNLEPYPTVKAYFLTHQLLTDVKNYSRFQEVRDFIINNIHLFELNEARQFLIILANVCFWNIREARFPPYCKENYIEERFNLISLLVEGEKISGRNRNYWKSVNEISFSHFHYIIQSAVDFDKLDWAREFMTKYLPFINEKYRQNLEILNRAYLNFHFKNYEAVTHDMRLMNGDFKFLHYYNATKFRTLELKFHYTNLENGSKKNMRFINSLLSSYLNFINSQNLLNKESKQQRFNFIEALRVLIRYKFNSDISKPELENMICKFIPAIELPWLLKEVKSIIKKNSKS